MKYTIAALMSLLAVGPSLGGENSITQMKNWDIVVADDATVSEQYAATEFQTLFRWLTGQTLEIRHDASGGGHAIYIAPGAAVDAPDVGFDALDMGEE